MTRGELRSTLLAFRSMVRARGPRECLEVEALDITRLLNSQRWTMHESWTAERMQNFAARAALRWWRWASKDTSRYARVFNK